MPEVEEKKEVVEEKVEVIEGDQSGTVAEKEEGKPKLDPRKEFFQLKEKYERQEEAHKQEKSAWEDNMAKLTAEVTKLAEAQNKAQKPEQSEQKDDPFDFDKLLGIKTEGEQKEKSVQKPLYTQEEIEAKIQDIVTATVSNLKKQDEYNSSVNQLDASLQDIFPGDNNANRRLAMRERVSKSMKDHNLNHTDAMMKDPEIRSIAFELASKRKVDEAIKAHDEARNKELAIKLSEAGFDAAAIATGLRAEDNTQQKEWDKMTDEDMVAFEKMEKADHLL